MPKPVNILPNERIDIPDFTQQTQGLSQGDQEQLLQQFILDNYPAVLNGFRVAIADQGSFPRVLTVHNAVAFDRDGQVVSNEDDLDAQRSITLPTTGTFYLEVQYVETASDTDARAFWDPTFDNGTDPSGDPRPKGREFTENVATRLTPDWQIITPVSTTGFEIDTNPNSTKIPVARIHVAGGGGGTIVAVTAAALTGVLQKVVSPSSTTAALFNTREMLDSFTLRFDPGLGTQEDITINGNDRTNNILTLGSTPVHTHPAGSRVIVAGATPTQFVPEGPLTAGTATSDARPRFFQASVDRGHLVNLDPTNGPATDADRARSDEQIVKLKQHVDFLAAQLQEMKFGNWSADTLGNNGPPYQNLDTRNNYYDSAGGLLGARTNTVSIGDGVTTWGDFNLAQIVAAGGTDLFDVMVAALDYMQLLPGQSGTIYIKAGTYNISQQLTLAGDCTIIGDGPSQTKIQLTGAAPFVTIGSGTLRLQAISVLKTTGSVNQALAFSSGGKLVAQNCDLAGLAGTLDGGVITACNFYGTPNLVTADLTMTTFTNCSFKVEAADHTSRCISSPSIGQTVFQNCVFGLQNATAVDWLVDVGSTNGVIYDNCSFGSSGTDKGTLRDSGAGLEVFRACQFLGSGNCLSLLNCATVTVDTCFLQWNANNHTGIDLGTGSTDVLITGNMFVQVGSYAGGQDSVAISAIAPLRLHIDNNDFWDVDDVIHLTGTMVHVNVRGNHFLNTTGGSGFGRGGILFGGTCSLTSVTVEANVFNDFNGNTANIYPIWAVNEGGTVSINSLLIRGNSFNNVGSGSGGSRVNAAAISLQDTTPGSAYGVLIAQNDIQSVLAPTTEYGVVVTNLTNSRIVNNHIISVGASGSASTWAGIRVSESDGVVVQGNTLDGIGNAAIAGSGAGIDILKTVANPGAQHNGYSITGNTLRFIYPHSLGNAGIRLLDLPGIVTVANNTIELQTDSTGIFVSDTDTTTDAPQIYNLTIVGNSVVALAGTTNGITCQYARSVAGLGGRLVIGNNVVTGFATTGIKVSGPSTSEPVQRVAITGNVLTSGINSTGISIISCQHVTIGSNVVDITPTTGTSTGIKVATSYNIAINGNIANIYTNDASSASLDLQDTLSTYVAVTGNTLQAGNTGGAANSSCCWFGATSMFAYAVGNMFVLKTAGGGTGYPIKTAGIEAVELCRAYDNVDTSSMPPSVPGVFGSIGLNIRVT